MDEFDVGDAVHCRGYRGVITEVVGRGDDRLFSVRLDPWLKGADGRYYNPENPDEVRDHEADTLGMVRGWELDPVEGDE